ncbi:MAG: pyridoxamine 5'-phosphate oxidase family protein [Promethearchaeota archaeon]|jgi:general stress protein 26
MPLSKEDLNQLFDEARIAIVCTLNKNSTIHAVPLWFVHENGLFYFIMHKNSRKVMNLKRNNKVSLSIMIESEEASSFSKIALVYGEAIMEEQSHEDYIENLEWRLKKYLTPKEIELLVESSSDTEGWLKVTVKPNKIISYNP